MAAGRYRPNIDRVWSFDEIVLAHRADIYAVEIGAMHRTGIHRRHLLLASEHVYVVDFDAGAVSSILDSQLEHRAP